MAKAIKFTKEEVESVNDLRQDLFVAKKVK